MFSTLIIASPLVTCLWSSSVCAVSLRVHCKFAGTLLSGTILSRVNIAVLCLAFPCHLRFSVLRCYCGALVRVFLALVH